MPICALAYTVLYMYSVYTFSCTRTTFSVVYMFAEHSLVTQDRASIYVCELYTSFYVNHMLSVQLDIHWDTCLLVKCTALTQEHDNYIHTTSCTECTCACVIHVNTYTCILCQYQVERLPIHMYILYVCM